MRTLTSGSSRRCGRRGIRLGRCMSRHRGLSDEAIIGLSRNPPRIILTEDKDFGEWVFAHGIRGISVIFLRYSFQDTDLLIATLLELLRTRLPDLQGAFTTVGV